MYIASVSESLKIWNASTDGTEFKLHRAHRSISEYLCLSWNPTNQVVAVGGRENKVHIIQANNGVGLHSFQVTDAELTNFKVPAIAFSNNSRYITVSVDNNIQLWDLKTKQIKSVMSGHKGSVVSLQYNSNGDFFGADDHGSIKLWSSKSYEAVNITDDSRGARPIHSLTKLAISSIAPIIAAGYDDGSVRVWDIANGINAICQLPIHSSKLTDVSCSTKNARLIATASLDEHIHLIDIGAPSRFVCSSIHVEQRITAISFHEDGMHCAVGATDGTILLYDWRNTSEPVSVTSAHEPFPVHALAFQYYRPSSSAKEPNSEYTVESVRSNLKKAPVAAVPKTLEENLAVFDKSYATTQPAAVTTSPVKSIPAEAPVIIPSPGAVGTKVSSSARHNDIGEEPVVAPVNVSSFAASIKTGQRYHQPINSMESSVDESRNDRDIISKVASTIEEKTSSFKNEYNRRVGAYLEVGQDRKHQRDRDFEEDVRQSLDQVSISVPPLPAASSGQFISMDRTFKEDSEDFAALREAVKPVTHKELEEALDLLKYDIHQELQEVMREQVRQFTIAKEETSLLVRELGKQLKDLIRANEELREENAYLRKIY